MIVLILCAIVMTVASLKHCLMVYWIRLSALTSMLAVASSIRTSLLFLKIALAMHTSCFSPIDKLSPESEMRVSRPYLSLNTSYRQHFFRVYNSIVSVYYFLGSRFSRKVPSIMTGYWEMRVMLDLKSLSGMSIVFFPSIKMAPSVGSTILKIDEVIVDFPAPVLPTIPIFSPALTLKVRLFKTLGKLGRYFKVKWSNYT